MQSQEQRGWLDLNCSPHVGQKHKIPLSLGRESKGWREDMRDDSRVCRGQGTGPRRTCKCLSCLLCRHSHAAVPLTQGNAAQRLPEPRASYRTASVTFRKQNCVILKCRKLEELQKMMFKHPRYSASGHGSLAAICPGAQSQGGSSHGREDLLPSLPLAVCSPPNPPGTRSPNSCCLSETEAPSRVWPIAHLVIRGGQSHFSFPYW